MMKTAALIFTVLFWAAVSAQAEEPTTGYAPVNGLKMYYEIHGSTNDIQRLGAQIFTRSDQTSPKISKQLCQALSNRSFSVDGKQCFALCCGELNCLAGRDKVEFRFSETAPHLTKADIILNPTHDRMGNAGTVLAKRRFLSSPEGNRSRAYVSSSNWNLSTRAGAQRQDSRTWHSAFVNGAELKMNRIASSSNEYEYREVTI
jgi:hypothetical protein